MKHLNKVVLASLCCMVCGLCMAGCGGSKQDQAPDPKDPGRGLTVQERKDKRGE